MFTALGIYPESFEKPFLECTSEFYAAEGVKYMHQSDAPDYLKHVEIRLSTLVQVFLQHLPSFSGYDPHGDRASLGYILSCFPLKLFGTLGFPKERCCCVSFNLINIPRQKAPANLLEISQPNIGMNKNCYCCMIMFCTIKNLLNVDRVMCLRVKSSNNGLS
ncbi:uncharacterized protein LOC106769981 [Vigna radiata var. radiata]|uniref:Uncharacterized protein LOC106769981 n=1 Tax=Vigna radiata var. radiata TaxID=3916 RepID=A0A3Q0FFC9_VIGRR|nr:uncharacterized protein LOC106769981 [Vigna radiata var. radiata]